MPLREISFLASIENGRLEVEPIEFSISSVELRGTASLSREPRPSIELALRSAELRPEDAFRLLELPEFARGVLNGLEIRLQTSGRSLGELFERTDFSLSVNTGDVQVSYDLSKDPLELHLDGANLVLDQRSPARLVVSGIAETWPFDLTLSGGQFSSLIRDGGTWPALDLELNTRLFGEPLMLSGSTRCIAEPDWRVRRAQRGNRCRDSVDGRILAHTSRHRRMEQKYSEVNRSAWIQPLARNVNRG